MTYLVENYARQPVSFVRGRGSYLFDERGRKYLDAFAGVAVSSLGHAHPRLVEAIAGQARTLLHTSNHYTLPCQEELAKALVEQSFPGKVLFCNSGTEANEAAYKLVRLWGNGVHGGRKHRVLAFAGGFHGRTLGSLSVTASPAYREPFAPLAPAEFLPFGDLGAFERAMGEDVAAVFMEPIQGEGGVHVPSGEFVRGVREACTRHGALWVVDEVQTGIGRTGCMFAYQHEDVTPDVMTLAKGLGGGVPIGAMVAREDLAALLKPGLHGTTFGGNPLACAAGLAVLEVVTGPGFLSRVAARGRQLRDGLHRIFGDEHELRGRGLLLGVQLHAPPAKLIAAALAEGLVVGPAGSNTLRISPPLTIDEEEVEALLEKLALAHRR